MAAIVHSEDNAGGDSVCGKKDTGDVTTAGLGAAGIAAFVAAPCKDAVETEWARLATITPVVLQATVQAEEDNLYCPMY